MFHVAILRSRRSTNESISLSYRLLLKKEFIMMKRLRDSRNGFWIMEPSFPTSKCVLWVKAYVICSQTDRLVERLLFEERH